MIPRLDPLDGLERATRELLAALAKGRFRGDIHTDLASRLTAATDNSIYQVLPQAVVHPRDLEDIALLARLLDEPHFHGVTVTPRGGGTGTNGQSLSNGIILDLARHMNRIIEVNVAEHWVRVQPGVVLGQLNAAMKPHGLFFAPMVSSADRATIGGMISTDAAGEGSRVYGKTSNHVLELTTVLIGGTKWTSREVSIDELERIKRRDDHVGEIHRIADEIATTKREVIRNQFPKLARFMTGYNMAMVRPPVEGRQFFNLNWLLTGAEGTLGIIAEAKLRLTPLPRHRTLVVMKFASFDSALGCAEYVTPFSPHAIETMDEKLLAMAKTDEAYLAVRDVLEGGAASHEMRAINLVEFAGDDEIDIDRRARALAADIDRHAGEPDRAIGCCVVKELAQRNAMWTLRQRAVGLLGNLPGRFTPVPFVEDCVVPPEGLREFVREFRAMLDSRGLDYGMFGHIDAGCLHVRPALDMLDSGSDGGEAQLRPITEAVAALAQQYGGVLWGEHGKGFRSEFNPMFFGEELFNEMRRIKRAFDPRNQLNPRKMATASETSLPLVTIEAPTRGSFDREIDSDFRGRYDDAIRCNGNGQCFSVDPDFIMCPSEKGTRDRVHSPKGRATVMREWLRRLTLAGRQPRRNASRRTFLGLRIWNALRDPLRRTRRGPAGEGSTDFSHEVYEAMSGCLACKACATQCPVKVDVPDFRADFLELYHTRYLRPLRDHLVAGLETMLPRAARAPGMPGIVNAVGRSAPGRWLLSRLGGIVDAPAVATPTLAHRLRDRRSVAFDPESLRLLGDDEKRRHVIVVQDAFTSFLAPTIVVRVIDLLRHLGFEPHLLPYFPSGKPLHVKGFVSRFNALARRNAERLREVALLGIDMIGVDPAITLVYRDEYIKALGDDDAGFHVHMLHEWLAARLADRAGPAATRTNGARYRLFCHCTERALAPESPAQWRTVFNALGLALDIIRSGCCGMCGSYGHERIHVATSRGIFDLSWARHLAEAGDATLLATGYSCRSQVERFTGRTLPHPAEALADALCPSDETD